MKINKSSFVNASAIVERLPFHQQLSQSQLLLSKLTPIWSQWAKQHLPIEMASCISPKFFHDGTLGIECTNAVAATQIQQRQQTLLDYFHQQGLTQIQHFAVRIANTSNSQRQKKPTNSNFTDTYSEHSSSRPVLSNDSAFDSIKSCQKGVNHQPLSDSLGRLLKTLQNSDN